MSGDDLEAMGRHGGGLTVGGLAIVSIVMALWWGPLPVALALGVLLLLVGLVTMLVAAVGLAKKEPS